MNKLFQIFFLSILVFSAKAQDNIDRDAIYLMPVNAPDSVKHRNKMDKNGKKSGRWEYYSKTGRLVLAVNYENNKREGEYIRYQPMTGKPFEKGYYSNGVKTGTYIRYYTDGTLRVKGNYKDGLKQGVWEYYYKSSGSVRAKGNFDRGRKHGVWSFYDYSEVLKRTIEYSDGKIIQSDDTIQFINKSN
jgi:antitoxin component YwqK of YwqJK toxin-antitoxin module